MEFLIGVGFLVTSAFAFWLALPRDGEVRKFLQNDHVQAYYTVAMVAFLVIGLINVLLGVMTVIGPL